LEEIVNEIVNAILDNFPEEVERITQAIKKATLVHFENALDRLFLAGFIA
jgi:hypothetical protein